MRKLVVFISIFLLLNSCEKYIEFDEEISTPKLVVNGIINPDSTFDIHISRSLSVLDQAELNGIENASVTIYDDLGNVYEVLSDIGNGFYTGNLKPLNEEGYGIIVSANDYETVSSITRIPRLVVLNSLDTLGVEDVDGFKELEITVEFDDTPGESNYYLLEVWAADIVNGQIYENPMSIRSDDITLGLSQDGYATQVYFSDELFDGEKKTLVFYVEDTRDYDDYIEVRFTSITEELEKYGRTLQAYRDAVGNPFSQPVQVYTNVENGFGIFAGYQLSRTKIVF